MKDEEEFLGHKTIERLAGEQLRALPTGDK